MQVKKNNCIFLSASFFTFWQLFSILRKQQVYRRSKIGQLGRFPLAFTKVSFRGCFRVSVAFSGVFPYSLTLVLPLWNNKRIYPSLEKFLCASMSIWLVARIQDKLSFLVLASHTHTLTHTHTPVFTKLVN